MWSAGHPIQQPVDIVAVAKVSDHQVPLLLFEEDGRWVLDVNTFNTVIGVELAP